MPISKETRDENKKEGVKKETTLSPIKTFRSDAQEKVQKSNLSVISIATAQSKKRIAMREKNPPKEESNFKKNLLIIVVSLFLISSGSGLAWFFYQNSLKGSGITPEESILSLIFAEKQATIDVSGIHTNIFFELEKRGVGIGKEEAGTLLHLYLTEESLGNRNPLSANEFLRRVGPNVPDRLIRSVEEEYTLGQYFGTGSSNYFLVLKTDSFENTFASMLEWEDTLQKDLSPFFGEALEEIASTKKAGTSTTEQSGVIIPRIFHDVIMQNIDTRLLRDDNGNAALIYAFPNANTLVISNNEAAFFEVVRRLSTRL